MQKGVRFNEGQLLYLASKARNESTMSGFLSKKSSDTGKWQLRYFVLYQNMLFYFENDTSSRPSGVALMEGSYCERVITPVLVHKGKDSEKQYCFTITYRSEGQRQYDLRSESESECKAWIDVLQRVSYSKVQELKEELEQKHLHLLQILDSERKAKWQYVQQTEELATEVKKLKAELQTNQKENVPTDLVTDETDEIKKIKKEEFHMCFTSHMLQNEAGRQVERKWIGVQSFFRGWLCRRRWKQIVELYIRSPHAESMRKRNSIVFNMVECEEEYNRQLSCLVTYYLRPLRMAASSKKPPISHEDVNSIFLNSETLLFLHQIFLKGLTARLENWPTLVLGDLFDMLLPMLNIYQEYVRNHHYSLQVLSEYKQRLEFSSLLRRYEEKPACEGRTLETFLTYPMHQIPRYIITLHELLAHTPHEHVERRSLEFAKSQLEELSKVMHDEVSETENIRKNLSIERMIVEGCDILLDVNQTFIRQGPLLQVILERGKSARGRLGSFNTSFKESRKEAVRQVFLFTNHILLTARASNGRLHLVKTCGKIPLTDCTLIEDPASDVFFFDEETSSLDSNLSLGSHSSASNLPCQSTFEQGKMNDYNGFDFRLIVDSKSGPPTSIYLVASTLHEKSAWCSDIGQCIENLLYSDLLNSSTSESSSVTMPQSVRTDPKLFRDDVDIKFSRTLNSCKVPQIRHASVERLLERLTDLRFLSIDFLNTFLLTYRVFTTGSAILESLRNVYKNTETTDSPPYFEDNSSSPPTTEFTNVPPDATQVVKPQAEKTQAERRMSKCGVNEVLPEVLKFKDPVGNITGYMAHAEADRVSPVAISFRYERTESMESDDSRPELANYLSATKHKLAPIASFDTLCDVDTIVVPAITTDDSFSSGKTFSRVHQGSLQDICDDDLDSKLVPPINSFGLGLSDSSLPVRITSPNTVSSAASSDTLTPGTPRLSPIPFLNGSQRKMYQECSIKVEEHDNGMFHSYKGRERQRSLNIDALALSSSISVLHPRPASSSPVRAHSPFELMLHKHAKSHSQGPSRSLSPTVSPKLRRAPSPISFSYSTPNIVTPQIKVRPFSGKAGGAEAESVAMSTPRGSLIQIDGSPPQAKPGTVVTSSRASKRRSSSSAATTAFAAATAGAGLPSCPDESLLEDPGTSSRLLFVSSDMHSPQKRDSVIFTAATMRVLNVIKHWVSKHQLDFESDSKLKESVITTLEEMQNDTNLLPSEHKAASSILRTINKETSTMSLEELTHLLSPPKVSSKDNFDTLSALDIAEQLTFLDHKIFMSISSEELLSQSWMKPDKSNKAVHVLLVSKRFNEVSRLVVSEVVRRPVLQDRVTCIEKWAAIADICRCMHNYNGVLQICAAFVNSSVYRLKKTWEKIPKQTKHMIDKLQILVSSEGRFKNMREALHRCDPPCIPYLGMYLTDLSFIEEGTPNFTDDGLVNFSKMRMIAHVIREIQLFQHTWYKIEHHPRVTAYLLDPANLLDEERTYRASLDMEPKHSRLSVVSAPP